MAWSTVPNAASLKPRSLAGRIDSGLPVEAIMCERTTVNPIAAAVPRASRMRKYVG